MAAICFRTVVYLMHAYPLYYLPVWFSGELFFTTDTPPSTPSLLDAVKCRKEISGQQREDSLPFYIEIKNQSRHSKA